MKDIKIFADEVEDSALEQINTLANTPAFYGAKIRIMPDCHAGKGCVIGFTADLGAKVVPSLVGVDIGCGMFTVRLGDTNIDLPRIDEWIHENIPSGMDIHNKPTMDDFALLYCLFTPIKNFERITRSMGTLGGGNHFIEIDEDDDGVKYLIVHTGSRNLGLQIANYHQQVAINRHSVKGKLSEARAKLIGEYKAAGREKELQFAIQNLENTFDSLPDDLCYLTGEEAERYVLDARVAANFADANRKHIAWSIIEGCGLHSSEWFTTAHNYIGRDGIIRKGAISAKKDEQVLIPLNMRDGSLICTGKGNDDWNNSAPHGAGRSMSRTVAKKTLSLDDFKEEMKGIYSTTIGEGTLDEAPAAYKDKNKILDKLEQTVTIDKVLHPIYNFKSTE